MIRLNLFTLLVLVVSSKCFSQSVLFGERHAEDGLALYFDKEGNLYPNLTISDADMLAAGSSLANYYQKNPSFLAEAFEKYEVDVPNIDSLNKAIFENTLDQLDRSKDNINFLIHGFRKSYNKQNDDETAFDNFSRMVVSVPKTQERQFVKVFWDGLYDCCLGTNISENNRIFKLYEDAQTHAIAVGKSFGKLLESTQLEGFTIVTFSLGAKVATAAIPSVKLRYKPMHFLMVAPAIGGNELKAALENVERRNKIKVTIVYNSKDFVLLKKDPKAGVVGPGPEKHGLTTLGCNYKDDAVYTEKYLDLHRIDCSLVNFDFIGKTHKVDDYFADLYAPLIWGY